MRRIKYLLAAAIAAAALLLSGCSSRQIEVLYESEKMILTAKELSEFYGNNGTELVIYTGDGDAYREKSFNIPRNVQGIVVSPPQHMITDVRKMVEKYLESGQKVLLIYIDGLGYDNYCRFVNDGTFKNIAELGEAKKAITVLPSITDVTFTSMVSGTTPKYHGIRKRGDEGIKAETIFDALNTQGKTYSLVEGNIKILKDNSEPILNIDANNNGTIDDEILASALSEAKKQPDFLLVHFHSFDDFGHSFGPYSPQASAQAKLLDEYTGELLKQWKGAVIVTADHGMHAEGSGGSHGTFTAEDMYIPIIDAGIR